MTHAVAPDARLRMLALRSQLIVTARWRGVHCRRTAAAWLCNLDAHRAKTRAVLGNTLGRGRSPAYLGHWHLFLMACAELRGDRGSDEWWVPTR